MINLLESQIAVYQTRYPDEDLSSLLSQLDDERSDDSWPFLSRHNMRGHITASAFVVNPARTHVLLIDHAFLKMWLQPGGHWECDVSLLDAARREVVEETGVICEIEESVPLDIDSHTIPANEKKNEDAHVHHDFVFLATADPEAELTHQVEEVHEAKWIPIADIMGLGNRLSRIAGKITGYYSCAI